jgi:hypothetical protein
MAGNTPSNPSKAPSVPTGPRASSKGSKSKVMSPMSKAGTTTPRGGQPASRRSVNSRASSQTVQGGPRK